MATLYEMLFGWLGGDPDKTHQENLEQHYLDELEKELAKRRGVGDEEDAAAEAYVAAGKWLYGLGGVALAIGASPFIYEAIRGSLASKRSKKASYDPAIVENASTRLTTLATALIPAFGMPIAYITVQALEGRKIINKDLGNAVQGLITAGATAPALGGAMNLLATAIKPVKGK